MGNSSELKYLNILGVYSFECNNYCHRSHKNTGRMLSRLDFPAEQENADSMTVTPAPIPIYKNGKQSDKYSEDTDIQDIDGWKAGRVNN